ATGGVVAAGAAVALNLNRLEALAGPHLEALTRLIHQSPITYANTQANNPISQPTPHTQANTSQPTPTAHAQNKKGTVIGNTQQKANSAIDFTNPANDTPAILVRLPNNTFAAYDKACTHVGVLVNYDPATQMLVCPAHGAIFDPAKGGA